MFSIFFQSTKYHLGEKHFFSFVIVKGSKLVDLYSNHPMKIVDIAIINATGR
jgi:hypothetical protein